jgi:hypothetical protein
MGRVFDRCSATCRCASDGCLQPRSGDTGLAWHGAVYHKLFCKRRLDVVSSAILLLMSQALEAVVAPAQVQDHLLPTAVEKDHAIHRPA